MGRSVIAVMAEPGISLPALLACLNSSLLAEVYRSLAAEEGRVLPQVKVGRLHMLPVPAVASRPVSAAVHREAAPISQSAVLPIDDLRLHPSLSWAVLHHLALHLLDAGGLDAELDARIETVVGILYDVDAQGSLKAPLASKSGSRA
jgi:hypothetical protein